MFASPPRRHQVRQRKPGNRFDMTQLQNRPAQPPPLPRALWGVQSSVSRGRCWVGVLWTHKVFQTGKSTAFWCPENPCCQPDVLWAGVQAPWRIGRDLCRVPAKWTLMIKDRRAVCCPGTQGGGPDLGSRISAYRWGELGTEGSAWIFTQNEHVCNQWPWVTESRPMSVFLCLEYETIFWGPSVRTAK